ncbi:MAG: PQQ-dependent sugar dehydrogenase [Candidatus Nanohaloarchaea archaeon]|nr:PQQ-dependent sugar dehydrogenase [Candidatus Nanohaloarchaea archaeon]
MNGDENRAVVFLILFLMALVAGIGVSLFMGSTFSTNSAETVDAPETVSTCQPPGKGENSVLKCFDGGSFCRMTTISERPVNCSEWYGSSPSADCDCTTHNLNNVSMITDPVNYVMAPTANATYSETVVTSKIPNGWDLEPLPNDRGFLVTLHNGSLIKYNGSTLHILGNIDVYNRQMAGLMGLAIDPNFSQNKRVYLYYTYDKVGEEWERFNYDQRSGRFFVKSRISRFEVNNGKLVNQTVLVDQIPGDTMHTGGRLETGPDDNLWFTVGDAGNGWHSFYKKYMNGKIMRVNLNGSIPSKNPFKDSLVYTRGHRNPQGLAWNPQSGNAWSSEHSDWRNDEINRLKKGEWYGWPIKQCRSYNGELAELSDREITQTIDCLESMSGRNEAEQCSPGIRSKLEQTIDEVDSKVRRVNVTPADMALMFDEATSPAACSGDDWTLAPSGMTFVDDSDHPWYGDLFVAGLRSNHLHRFDIENGEVDNDSIFYIPEAPGISARLRDVEFHDGSLWILGDSHGIVRLSPS